MIKLLDYYYLVLLRYMDCIYGKDKSSYKVPGIVAFTLSLNLFSFAMLINSHFIDIEYFWIPIGILILITIVIDVIYNKKRRARLREQYKDESSTSRQRGVVFVVLYAILSIAFLILAIWMVG